MLAQIHNAIAQYPELEGDFGDRRFFEELRLEPYYGFTATQIPAARPFLAQLIDDTRARRHALVHGDYSPKNVHVHADQLILLDFEVIHFGDPAFDIGFSLTHFLSKAHFLPACRAVFLDMAREYWRSYLADLAPNLREVDSHAVKHTLACLLARVAGRSPLEYLGQTQRDHQQKMVLSILADDVTEIPLLIDAFDAQLAVQHE